MFSKRLPRRQCHDHWGAPIMPGDSERRVVEHSVHEGCHLSEKTLGITLDEEVER
jgi:hypothetical protein